MKALFPDRTAAGLQLAAQLKVYAQRPDVIVLGLPRGGVPVAFEIAKALQVPLDICLVRKLGVPHQPELAMGAIASDGIRVLNFDLIASLGISSKTIDAVAAREIKELQRRDRAYRGDRPSPDLKGKTVIVVDDGIATGASLRAAIAVLRLEQPQYIVVAVPIAPAETYVALKNEVDHVVCLATPSPFCSIGVWYDNFAQTTDETVRSLLAQGSRWVQSSAYSTNASP
jgi:putative phosphoribosyl transferase